MATIFLKEEAPDEGLVGEIKQGIDEASNHTLDMKVDAEKISEIVHLMR